MGMSTHVVGVKPPDEKWQRMKAIWDACMAARVDPPREVMKFFEGETPDPLGVRVGEFELRSAGCLKDWCDPRGSSSGVELDLAKLPPGVTVLRFVNSW
jgi:hypothetical protein